MSSPETNETDRVYQAVAFIVITQALEILAEERRKTYSPYYGKKVIPAGLIEEGEEDHEAVKREISEETGIENSSPIKIGSFTGKSLRNEPIQFQVYLLQITNKALVQTLEPEKSAHHWIPLATARTTLELDTSHKMLNLLEIHLNSLEAPDTD